MSLVDQFESLFRSADRRRYEYSRPEVRSVLVITDLGKTAADALVSDLRHFLVEVAEGAWTVLDDGSYGDVGELLDTVNAAKPDLIVSYRNLRNDDWRWPYSLGSYLNVLLRETDYPVLVVPNPHELPDLRLGDRSTERVMVLADHLTGDHRLVNYGARFTRPEGKLHLVHVEDDQTFERYIDVIGKIPAIDTDIAREDIKERGQWDPIDEAIKAAQARVNLDDPRVDDRLRRIRGAMLLKVRTSKLASRVGTCVEIKVRALHAVDATT